MRRVPDNVLIRLTSLSKHYGTLSLYNDATL